MKLAGFKLFSQNDPLWKNKKLGTSTVSTIGSYGCALTCVTMVCNYYGKEITVDVLNDQLKAKGGFVNGSYIVWGAVTDVFGDITVDWGNYIDCSDVPAPLVKIDELLYSKKPVIVKVDYDKNLSGVQEHWIVIIGKTDDGSYICADPWDGIETFFQARYGDPAKNIYKIVVYNGTPKITTSLEDKIRDLEDKVQSLNTTTAELSLENNNLRTELSAQEKENDDLFKQLNEARDKADSLDWKNKELEIKVKTLQEALDVSSKVEAGLRDDLVKLQEQSIDGIPPIKLIFLGIKKLIRR